MSARSDAIRCLNDDFRKRGPASGTWRVTAGVQELGLIGPAIQKVVEFDCFTPDNDPHGEHDFGSFSLDRHKLFWKIDYYDQDLEFGSENPADLSVTRRVLTIMLASEY